MPTREAMNDFLESLRAQGIEPSEALIQVCELLPELTRDELKEIYDQLLADTTSPEDKP
jgi:hypothetical protein